MLLGSLPTALASLAPLSVAGLLLLVGAVVLDVGPLELELPDPELPDDELSDPVLPDVEAGVLPPMFLHGM